MKRLIYVCSPYRSYEGHTVEQNMEECIEFCRLIFEQGDVAVAPQLWLPKIFNDEDPNQRRMALKVCKSLIALCDRVYVYVKPGRLLSDGMTEELNSVTHPNFLFIERYDALRGKFRENRYAEEIAFLCNIVAHEGTKFEVDTPCLKVLEKVIEILKGVR